MQKILDKIKEINKHNRQEIQLRNIFIDEFLQNKDIFYNMLYVHTPFCSQHCNYCVYTGYTNFNKKDLNFFINNNLKKQIDNYSKIFDNVKFDIVYFGGGTPNIYDAEQLEKLYYLIPNFKDIKYKMTEVHPAILTNEQIKLYKKYNFKYISLGIQTFDEEIIKKYNRIYFSKKDFKTTSEKLDNLFYNVDLIEYLDNNSSDLLNYTRNDLKFLGEYFNVPAITINHYSKIERTEKIVKDSIDLIKEYINKYDYVCINSNLDYNDIKLAVKNGIKKTLLEFKLVKKDRVQEYIPTYLTPQFSIHNTYGMNLLSIGYTNDKPTYSYTGNINYEPSKNILSINNNFDNLDFIHFLYCLKVLKKNGIYFPSK